MTKRILAIAEYNKLKKWILIISLIVSFALINVFNIIASYSVFGICLSLFIIFFFGILYWLIFEIIAGLFYGALKPTLEKFMNYGNFINLLRMIVLISNILIFFAMIIFISLNFYTAYLLLFFNVIISFLMLIFFYKAIMLFLEVHLIKISETVEIENKNTLQNSNIDLKNIKSNAQNKNNFIKKDFEKIYFKLVFVYLFLLVLLWGIV